MAKNIEVTLKNWGNDFSTSTIRGLCELAYESIPNCQLLAASVDYLTYCDMISHEDLVDDFYSYRNSPSLNDADLIMLRDLRQWEFIDEFTEVNPHMIPSPELQNKIDAMREFMDDNQHRYIVIEDPTTFEGKFIFKKTYDIHDYRKKDKETQRNIVEFLKQELPESIYRKGCLDNDFVYDMGIHKDGTLIHCAIMFLNLEDSDDKLVARIKKHLAEVDFAISLKSLDLPQIIKNLKALDK